ncbi:hypothetical protein [Paraherbaspirillum soli]|uniref:Uncharacterized protein n=1 Tax=Paraherbaspirillum soli TaxID=631222 RepID=A0ABW0M5U6_9BURK
MQTTPALNQASQVSYFQTVKAHLRTTPGRMQTLLAAGIVGALLIALTGFGAYQGVRGAVQTLGKDTVPSIVAAEQIRFLLASAHANAMNAVLLKEDDSGTSSKAFRAEMDQAQQALVTAAKNITYGSEEQKPITAVMMALGSYERLLGQAHAKGAETALPDLTAANQLMQTVILPATVALDQANFDHLTASFNSHHAAFYLQMTPLVLIALATLAALLAAQTYLMRKTRRTLNLGLLAATVILGLASLYGATSLQAIEKKLVSSKFDAFDSIHSLSKARALAYEANADESLLLIYRGHPEAQAQATADFKQRIAQIMAIEPAQLDAATKSKTKFGGLLGAELVNITYPGEEAAALLTARTWADYVEIDKQIRELESSGRYAESQALALGYQAGQSNWAFDAFDKALGKTTAINQAAFDQDIADAFARLNRFPYLLFGAVLASILAIVLGMKPRLDEYRF